MKEHDEITELQSQIVDLRRKFAENPDNDNVSRFFETSIELLRKQHECKLYEDAIKTYEEIIDLLLNEECFNTKGSYWYARSLPIHYMGEAVYCYTEILIDQEDFEAASDSVGRALGIRKHLYDNSWDEVRPINGRLLGNCYHQVARIAERLEKIDVTWEYLALYQEIYESNASITNAEREREFLARCYEDIGNTAMRLKEYSKAADYYQKELQEYMDLAADFDSPEFPVLVGRSYQNLGFAYEKQKQLDLAKENFEKSIPYFEEGTERGAYEGGLYYTRESLTVSWDHLAGIEWDAEQFSDAQGYYAKAYELGKEILTESGGETGYAVVVSAITGLAEYAEKQGEYVLAQSYYEERLRLNEHRIREEYTEKSRLEYADCLTSLGNLHENQGDLDVAYDYHIKAKPLLEELYNEKDESEIVDKLARNYEILGIILRKNGDLDKAIGYYARSKDLFKEENEILKTIESRRALAMSYDNLGVLVNEQGQLELAQEYSQMAFDIRQKLVDETDDIYDLNSLSTSYEHLGDCVWRSGEFEDAREYYEKCVSIRERVFSKDNSYDISLALSSGYTGLADLNRALGNMTLELDFRKKNMSIWEEIVHRAPTSDSLLYLDESYIQMAIAFSGMDDNVSAAEYVLKAIPSCEKLAAELNSSFAVRNLACAYIVYGIICMETGEKEKSKDLFGQGLKESKAVKKDSLLDSLVEYVKNEAADLIDPSFIDS